jgi:hypothetical protein
LNGQEDTLEELIGNDKEKLNYLLPVGSWLHFAIKSGKINIIQKLINMGIDKNIIASSHKGNPLVNAARSGRLDIVDLLLNNEFQFETNWTSANPLQEAISNNKKEVFNYILNKELQLLKTPEEKDILLQNCIEYAEIFGSNLITSKSKEQFKDSGKERISEEKFKNKIKAAINKTIKDDKLSNRIGDIYALALSTTRELTSIGIIANTETKIKDKSSKEVYYYKFNPEEWEIWVDLKDFNDVVECVDDFRDDLNDELKERLFKTCVTVLYEMKKELEKYFKKDIYLEFYVRDYYSDDDIIENMKYLNSKEYIEEFVGNIEQIP